MPSFERWKKIEDIVKKKEKCLSRIWERQNPIRGGGWNVKGVHLHNKGEDNMNVRVEGQWCHM